MAVSDDGFGMDKETLRHLKGMMSNVSDPNAGIESGHERAPLAIATSMSASESLIFGLSHQ
jgi:hypothetical protein